MEEYLYPKYQEIASSIPVQKANWSYSDTEYNYRHDIKLFALRNKHNDPENKIWAR